MTNNFLRIDAVCLCRGRGRSKVYKDIRQGIFPPPVRIGTQMSVWPSSEVDSLNRAEMRGATPEELRSLVQQLVERRLSNEIAA